MKEDIIFYLKTKMTSPISYLWKNVNVLIDRPIWSKHPKWWFDYELNYWFIPWTSSWDWEELDAYVIWIKEPLETFDWKCIAVIHRLWEDDDKLIVVPDWIIVNDEDIRRLTFFQEQYFESVILR